MDFKVYTSFRWFITLFTTMSLFFNHAAEGQSLPYQIAGNQTGARELTSRDASEILKGKRTFWNNGEEILIGLPSSKAPHAELVASKIFGTTVNGMQKYWLSLVFQGRGKSPQFFATAEEMLDWLQKTPGAIGVFPANFSIPSGYLIRVKD